ncbi:MAG: hypothetical protein WCD80_14300 [Desulfobaccales bacterium]
MKFKSLVILAGIVVGAMIIKHKLMAHRKEETPFYKAKKWIGGPGK